MDNPLTPEQQDFVIEDALHTHPLVPMPRDISAEVMARIQKAPAPRPFRLTWADMILGIVLSLCIGAVWFSLNNLPPLIVAQLRQESILLYQQIIVNARWLLPALFFGVAGFSAALTIPYLRQEMK